MTLYIPSICSQDDILQPTDPLNRGFHFDSHGVQSIEGDPAIFQVCHLDETLIFDYRGVWHFDVSPEMGGKWLDFWSIECEIRLYQADGYYRGEVLLLDEMTSLEMAGELEGDSVRLHTTQIHNLNSLTHDWLTHLCLIISPTNPSSFYFHSTFPFYISPMKLPSSIIFHNSLHSPILDLSSPTVVTNHADIKQWGMALAVLDLSLQSSVAPMGITSGQWVWDIYVKRCTTQYMGIGVTSLGSKFSSYLGRDFTGWAFQPTGEKWHANMGNPYGPPRPSYAEGDLISVEIDMDRGELGFFKNHFYLGIAFDKIKENPVVAKYGVFPAVTCYRSGDSLESRGFREGEITDLYPPGDPMKRVKWTQMWKLGKRHGYGMIEFRNGQKWHGIWRNGKRDDVVIVETPTEWRVESSTHLTDSQLQAYFGQPFTLDASLVSLLRSIKMPPVSVTPEINTVLTISGTGFLSPSQLFTFSPIHCAAGIELSHDLLTAQCVTNNRCMLLGSRGFTTGKIYWELSVEDCEYGTLFVGVAGKLAGSSHQCWRDYGFVSNRSVQDHANEFFYGVQYYKGDVIGVLLDMDHGEISFFKQGKDLYYSHHSLLSLGVAAKNIRTNGGEFQVVPLFPSVGFKRCGDSVSLQNMKGIEEGGNEAEKCLWNVRFAYQLMRAMALGNPEILPISAKQFIMQKFQKKDQITVLARGKIHVTLDTSQRALDLILPKAGLKIGQIIQDRNGMKRIIGTRKDQIWYQCDNKDDFWYFNKEEVKAIAVEEHIEATEVPSEEIQDHSLDWHTIISMVSHGDSQGIAGCVLRLLNQCVQSLIPLVGFHRTSSPLVGVSSAFPLLPSPCALLYRYKTVISFSAKKVIWQSILNSTGSQTTKLPDEMDPPLTIPEIKVNRVIARRTQQSDSTRADILTKSVLHQMVAAMEVLPIATFRRDFAHAEDAGQKRSFFVRLIGEGVYDSGGPYREMIETAVSYEPLHILGMAKKTANNENNLVNDETFEIVNFLDSENPAAFRRMQFYWGVLLGVALRGSISVSLPLSTVFYKCIVNDDLDESDLDGIDKGIIHMQSNWDDVISAFGSVVEVVEVLPCSGQKKREILALYEKETRSMWFHRVFREVLKQKWEDCEMVVRGMSTVVPLDWVLMFTHEEMRKLICGNELIRVQELKEIVEYAEGVDVNGEVIKRFWNVVEGFSYEERGKLLEFVCARTRIPAPPHPPISFKIAVVKGNDEMLPQSQTCFSILKLPPYSSEKVMRKQLLYAISNTPTMELDVQLHDAEGWN